MKIRRAQSSDFEIILTLWQESFCDSREYIENFWRFWNEDDVVLLLENDYRVIGMIHLLPCRLEPNQDAYYWYAACITKEERNKGYFRFFVTETIKALQQDGKASLCYPAAGLENFYQSCGFRYPYLQEEQILTKRGQYTPTNTMIEDADPSDFTHFWDKEGTCLWSKTALQYAFFENLSCDGKQFKVIINDQSYVGVAIQRDGYYEINHTNLSQELIETIQNSLFDYLQCEKILCRTYESSGKYLQVLAGLSDSPLVTHWSALPFNLS